MARPIWSGSISFGLVNVPVKLFSATSTKEELEAFSPKATRSIDIEDFVDLHQIDPIYYDHSYYLVPDRGAARPYALLLEAMKSTGKVGSASSCCGPSSTWRRSG